MKNNLPTIRQSTEVALSRANTLMDVADKILANQSTDLVDESWMEVLWQWEDDNEQWKWEMSIVGHSDFICEIKIKNFPRDKDILVNLKILRLWYKGMNAAYTQCHAKLPKEIGNLVNLTELSLRNNCVTELPKEIGNLVNLTRLNIGDSSRLPSKSMSQLTELPKEIGNLVNLTELYLSNNRLTKLPKEIGNLVNLTELRLSNNQLTKLPKEIGNLVNLDTLHLEGNQLTEVPKELQEWFDNIENTRL